MKLRVFFFFEVKSFIPYTKRHSKYIKGKNIRAKITKFLAEKKGKLSKCWIQP